jgi:hypothetical protein
MPMPHKFKGKSKWQASPKTPNASFRTLNRGTITINLATKGATVVNTKAFVQASAHKGDVSINLYSLQGGKHIHLDVSSRKGANYPVNLSVLANVPSHRRCLSPHSEKFLGSNPTQQSKGGA